MILEVQFQNFGARRRTRAKVIIFKKFQRAQILLMKIGMELPFTLKKRRNTNLKIDFLKVPFWTPEKVCFWFFVENPPKKCVLGVSALIQL